MNGAPTKVAIIGSGNIGIDLLFKIRASPVLDLAFIVGRNAESSGLAIAKAHGVRTSHEGLDFLKSHRNDYDMVFDATSASAHVEHNGFLSTANKFVIDLTPACIGATCVPSINLPGVETEQNVNLITCGGQASLPLAHALKNATTEIEYLEVVSTISAGSAGLATRANINEYLVTTERALKKYSGAKSVKAILNINPADPGVVMQTTVYAYATFQSFTPIKQAIEEAVASVKKYVPGYKLLLGPVMDEGRIMLSVAVRGSGHYLPEYAGNLDIINCSAVAVAEHRHHFLRSRLP